MNLAEKDLMDSLRLFMCNICSFVDFVVSSISMESHELYEVMINGIVDLLVFQIQCIVVSRYCFIIRSPQNRATYTAGYIVARCRSNETVESDLRYELIESSQLLLVAPISRFHRNISYFQHCFYPPHKMN